MQAVNASSGHGHENVRNYENSIRLKNENSSVRKSGVFGITDHPLPEYAVHARTKPVRKPRNCSLLEQFLINNPLAHN